MEKMRQLGSAADTLESIEAKAGDLEVRALQRRLRSPGEQLGEVREALASQLERLVMLQESTTGGTWCA